jgi:hypothetical protein
MKKLRRLMAAALALIAAMAALSALAQSYSAQIRWNKGTKPRNERPLTSISLV